jgi:preprotein translocase subunit SecG
MKFIFVLIVVGVLVCAAVVLSTQGAGNGNEIAAGIAKAFIGH